MTGFWLVSYIALWLFVFLETLLLLAFIRHIGNLRLWLRQAGVIRDLQPVEEGPPIGKSITGLNDVLRESLADTIELDSQKAKALIFVPAGFFGCDDLLLALKEFEHEHSETFQVIIVSFTPGVAGQFEVARKLGVQAPIITENGWKLASLCHVFTAPYAFVADPEDVVWIKMPVGDGKRLREMMQGYHQNQPE